MFILGILVLFIGGGLTLFAWRAPMLKQGGLFAPISREGALVFNNLFLTTACLTVFVGTLYPLALEALTGEKISVGAPFFNVTFGPLFVALILAMPFGPLLAWKRGDLLGVAQRLMTAFAVGLIAVAAAFAIKGGDSVLAPFGVGLAFFVMIGAVVDLVERTGLLRMPLATVLSARSACRARPGARRSRISASRCRCSASSVPAPGAPNASSRFSPAQTVSLSGYELTFDGVVEQTGPNYNAQVAKFTVREGGVTIGVDGAVEAQFLRARDLDQRSCADGARRRPALFVARRHQSDGSIAIRLYYKPLVMLIWLGALVMMFGGALSLSDRRLARRRAETRRQSGAAAGGVGRCAGWLCLRCSSRSSRPPRRWQSSPTKS